MQVTRLSDGLAVRLPDDVVRALDLHEGDDVAIDVSDSGEVKIRRKESFEEFMARLEEFKGMLPPDFKFDREEANAR